MANEMDKIERAIESIDKGIGDLREKNAGREVWEANTKERLDHLYDKTIPGLKERLEKVEAFQIKVGVYGGILVVVLPFVAPYILKAIFGE